MSLKSKLKRYFKRSFFILPIIITIFYCMFSVPVSAEGSYEALPITVTKVWTNHVEDNAFSQWDDNYYFIRIPYNSYKNQFASLWTVNNDDTTNYYSYKFKFQFLNMEPSDFTLTFNGVTYEVLHYSDDVTSYYYVDVHDIRLNNPNARLDLSFSFKSAASGSIYFQAFYQYSDINPVIDNQNENTDKIIDNQNSNTDEITNGWDTDQSADIEGLDDYLESESAILDDVISGSEESRQKVSDNFLASIVRGSTGLTAISVMFADFLESRVLDFGVLVYFSLGLGVLPLIAGASINLIRRSK